ncbi:NAD(P)-dependent oxidoreductase [Amycolatopsis magusensis]|uniref:3-hydroxyisobutyrate dehydrogenase-like beta-hydroxyacid dehydrogenase n=1 Tax=Amycolatopsis magusensis TaxID=882444 RepID=A0ABS4PZ43_9PSEU|nr:NAD(P)-binding domain-containing protein [Amycolatopsis magusensis]MBP2184133.1 3-hydroxyisobutyrate dehydrogenase-like beta-hydroxyacid dehydrogenase [Amycolatopsis magusensis]
MHSTDVTVAGLGAMGAALAQALVDAGHSVTVWNRTPGRIPALTSREVPDIDRAVAASPLTITCLTTYDATLTALEPAAGAFTGRTLITLNSGTPAGAREMAAWAAEHGADFLDGAVKNVPDAVGEPGTLLYYSGEKAVFDRHVELLRALGGDTVFLGTDVDLAALYESAVGGTLLPALLGFFQGAALVTARGLPAASLVPYTVKWLEMIGAVLPSLAEHIDTGDYSRPASSLGLFYEGIAHDHELARESGVDFSWNAPMHDLLTRAVEQGHREDSIAVLTELLR